MMAEEFLRYLDHETRRCNGLDAREALRQLVPSMMLLLRLKPMSRDEAMDFTFTLLNQKVKPPSDGPEEN